MRHVLSRRLPYSPEELFDLVGDVESYPRFVRWVTELRARNRRAIGPGVESLDAEARVRFGPLRERFSTRVRLDRPRYVIDVDLLSGPFKRLRNEWRFEPVQGGSILRFEIDFEFRSGLLDRLLAANFERAASTLVRCFETRAADLHGERSWPQAAGC